MNMTPLFERVTETLLHFLWQGAAIALLVVAATACLRRASANTRYCLNLGALLLMAACLPVTFYLIPTAADPDRAANGDNFKIGVVGDEVETLADPNGAATRNSRSAVGLFPNEFDAALPVTGADSSGANVQPSSTKTADSQVAAIAPYASAAYVAGVAIMLLRLFVALWGGQRLRMSSTGVTDQQLLGMVRRQATDIGLNLTPVVAYCRRVAVPVVIGILHPLILLPSSFATGMTPDQLQSILVHELAHIRRYDLMVNLLQRCIESVLFFHPALWYVSRRVSIERENACDDLVLVAGWQRVEYADALVRMAELSDPRRDAAGRVALAVSDPSPTQFKQRILRILNVVEPGSQLRLTLTGFLLLVFSIGSLLFAPVVVQSRAVMAANVTEIGDVTVANTPEGKQNADNVENAGTGGPPITAASQDDQWPPQDPVKFLKRLHLRDHELHSRSLQIERRWVAQIDPRAKVGAEIPLAYDQPHRVPYLVTTDGSLVWAIDNGHDLETMKHPASEKAIQAARWPIGPRRMAWNTVMMDGYFRETQQKHSLAQPFEWALGYGFARTLVSIDSMNAWKNDDRLVIKGKSRVFLYGRPRVITKNAPAGTVSVPEPDSHFEIELDRDLIVRRAVISLDLRSRGYEQMAPDAYRIKRFVVETSGTSRLIDAPPVAARGRFQRIAKDPKKSKGVQRDETIAFVGISGKLTQEELRQRLDRDREPYAGNASVKKGGNPKKSSVEIKKAGKSIVVDMRKFSELYPAVWFSPSTGEIAPLTVQSRKPPQEKYEIWIEPRDPEFRHFADQNPSDVGFSLLGNGDRVFQKAIIPDKPELKPNILDLMKEADTAEKPVFYCKSKKSECLIMFTAMDSTKGSLTFRWKRLGKDASKTLGRLNSTSPPMPDTDSSSQQQ